MVEEGVRWLEDDTIELLMSVGPSNFADLPPEWTHHPQKNLDYASDHKLGLESLRHWLAKCAPPCPKILEIGGNVYPAIAEIPGKLYNIDVDLLGLQIGCLVQDRRESERAWRRVIQICGDANNLPFEDRYFDCVVLFATLHHFPDPVQTLRHIAAKITQSGFIGLLCEPVGHVHPGAVEPNFLRELERGVNEQSFLAREWAQIIKEAGLTVVEATIDGGSLKAFLVH
jgi:SAM-dependent methyltransferase